MFNREHEENKVVHKLYAIVVSALHNKYLELYSTSQNEQWRFHTNFSN
jgi:hypothetical protein